MRSAMRSLEGFCIVTALACVTTSAAAAEPSPSATQSNETAAVRQAKESFNRGLALANAKDYRVAIAAFEQAYQLAPHYAVLYNIARSYAALGENDRAVLFLRRYLSEGGSQISAERVAQVEAEIAALLPQSEPEAAPAVEKPPVRTYPERERVPDTPTPSSAPTVDTADPFAKHRTLAYVLGGVGLGVAAGAGGLLLWNDGRYGDWKREDTDLQQTIAGNGASDETNLRQSANNDLLQSIRTVDVVTLVGGVVGLGLVGTGVYFYVAGSSKPDRVGTGFAVGPNGISLRSTW